MKRPQWSKKQADAGEFGGGLPRAGDLLGGKVEARKRRKKKAKLVGSESVAELREQVARAEEMIESYQLQLSRMREEMQAFHRRSIVDGLTAAGPSLASMTCGDMDGETAHSFLELGAEAGEDAETDFLPTEFASPIFYHEWEKFEDGEAALDCVVEEPGVGGGGVETGGPGANEEPEAGVEGVELENRRLREELEHLKLQYEVVKRLSVDKEEESGREVEQLRDKLAGGEVEVEKAWDYAAQMKRDLSRVETGRRRLQREVEAKEKEIMRLRGELEERFAPADIGEHREIPVPELDVEPDGEYEKKKDDLIAMMENEPSMEAIFAMRHLFLNGKQYDDGIGAFRKMLTNPRYSRFLPAICLVVGEMLKLAGRVEEANFYLTNPLIRNDSFAQHLLRKMKL